MRLSKYIYPRTFIGIADVARHHDKGKLKIAIEESELDLEEAFGSYWYQLYQYLKVYPLTEEDCNITGITSSVYCYSLEDIGASDWDDVEAKLADHINNQNIVVGANEMVYFQLYDGDNKSPIIVANQNPNDSNFQYSFPIFPDDLSDNEKILINGGEYEVDGVIHYTQGLRKIIACFAYARYIIINNTTDTINGLVKKDNDFSVPTPMRDLKDISNHYRNMAFKWIDGLKSFLCTYKDEFNYTSSGCNNCQAKTKNNYDNKRVGSSFKIIRK